MPPGIYDKSLEDTKRRFHQSYTIIDNCWLWNKYIAPNGYGSFSINNRHNLAHRISLMFHDIDIPEGYQIRHRCPKQHRHCVNPAHLTTGTVKQNAEDRKIDGTNAQGVKHGMVKLTEAQVLEIRTRNTENQKQLAKEFGVQNTTISMILNRKTWTYL